MITLQSSDPLVIAGRTFSSRLFVGTGRFTSPALMREALEASGAEMVTVAIRLTGVDGSGPDAGILAALDTTRYHLLPNTAGATSVRQAVFMVELAREALGTNWVKLEVIGDERTLWPDVAGTVEATRILVGEGFVVLPYTTTDLVTALRLEDAGAATVMPLGSMIGSGRGDAPRGDRRASGVSGRAHAAQRPCDSVQPTGRRSCVGRSVWQTPARPC